MFNRSLLFEQLERAGFLTHYQGIEEEGKQEAI